MSLGSNRPVSVYLCPQSLFLLPEVASLRASPSDPQVAVEMQGASLGWEGLGQSTHSSPYVRATRRHRQRDK